MRIAASMIVKDEERMILDCLRSLEGFIDVLVVEDTGSTDATIAIIEEWGLENPDIEVILQEEPWKGDFSYHRNRSFKAVPADVDWVLIIDADERVYWYNDEAHYLGDQNGVRYNDKDLQEYAPGWFKELLKQEKRIDKHDCLSALVRDIKVGADHHVYNNNPRLFRRWSKLTKSKKRRAGVVYKGTVHNRPDFRGGMLIAPVIGLNHLGYDGKVVDMEKKHNTRIPMMQAQLNKKPPDLQMWFFLAEQFGMLGDYLKCLAHAEMYRQFKDKLGRRYNKSVNYLGARTCMTLGKMEEALVWAEEGLDMEPDDLDLYHTLADIGAALRRDDLVIKGCDGYLRVYRKGAQAFKDRMVFTARPDVKQLCEYRAAVAYLRVGSQYFERWLSQLPEIEPVLRQRMLDDITGLVRHTGLRGIGDILPIGVGLRKEATHAA